MLDSPRRSLSSNSLYGAATDDVLQDSKGETPANDYSFVASEYPIIWEAPDLYTQVAKFLDEPAPQRAPKETVWVFTSGMWDVWSLAAFPYSKAESILTTIVYDIFYNIDILYDAAHNVTSIAYSDYSAVPLDEKTVQANATKTKVSSPLTSRGSVTSELPWDDTSSEPFRVMVPLLFDPSLVPGWHLDRPNAPELHTKPEQLRNAVRLTKRWNDYVTSEMDKWTKKNVTFVHPDDRPKLTFDTGAGDKKEGGKDNKPDVPSISTEPHRGGESGSDNKDATSRTTPTLCRDGMVLRMSEYLMDVIIDGQLQMRGLSDKKGFGKFSNSEGFREVDKPCLAPAVISMPNSANAMSGEVYSDAEEENSKKKNDKSKGEGGSNAPTQTKASPLAGATKSNTSPEKDAVKSKRQQQQQAAASSPQLQVCDHPDHHLFFTPFSLGQRAIEEIGRLSAAILSASRSTRTAWEKSRHSRFESDREPASWKEYYYND